MGNNKKNLPIRPNRIGEQLPYFEFEDTKDSKFHRVHLLQDGSLGVVWKCNVPASYGMDNGVAYTINELRTFLENLPADYEAQLIITTHNNLKDKLQHYLSLPTGDERAQQLRESRAEKLWQAGAGGYMVGAGMYSRLRDTQLLVTLRSPTFGDKLGALNSLISGVFQVGASVLKAFRIPLDSVFGRLLDDLSKGTLAEFNEVLLSTESTLSDMFKLERMSLEELKKHYWQAYAPSYAAPQQKEVISSEEPLNDQLFPLPIENQHEIVKIGDDYHGTLMLAMMPDVVGPDYLFALRRSLLGQHTLFCNFVAANQSLERAKLTLASELRKRVSNVFNREDAQEFAAQASEVKQHLFHGRKILYIMFGLIVHGKSKEEVEDTLLRLNATLKKASVVPDIERSMALQAMSYSWPLVFRNDYTRPFARTRRVLSHDIADLLPVHGHIIGDWNGKHGPQAMYLNRDDEIVFFDHTSPEFVNWHYAITGTSGSGKSFAVVDLTLQLYSAGVKKQYLMTIKDDYDRFAQTMGRLIIIDLDRQESCINPFGGEINKNRLQQWSQAVQLMIQRGEFQTDRIENRLIEQVVAYAYDIVPEDDMLRPTWIREAFKKFPYEDEDQREAGYNMATEIGSYCEEGVYGKLFDGPPAISEDDKLVVFNLQNVLNESISDVIIFSIFTMLDNVMYQGDRGERKHLLVDEMISMISAKGGAAVANQIKRAFRTYRSLNCMCGIASQNEEDLTTDVGQAVIGNITKRLILKPRKEMIPVLMKSLGLRSERHEANIGSLDTKPGYYSEFYLMSPHGETVCRLLTDKLTYALATTTPDDVAEIQRLKAKHEGDWWQATLAFAEQFPNGVRAAKAAKNDD
jgi:hypothetical protein